MKTSEIQLSKSQNKVEEYITLATELNNDTQETAETISDELLVRIAAESARAFRALKNADCEYTIYVNCLEVEAWNNRVAERLESL